MQKVKRAGRVELCIPNNTTLPKDTALQQIIGPYWKSSREVFAQYAACDLRARI
jgi:hypothetical protein